MWEKLVFCHSLAQLAVKLQSAYKERLSLAAECCPEAVSAHTLI